MTDDNDASRTPCNFFTTVSGICNATLIDIVPTLDMSCTLKQRKCDEKICRYQQTSEWGF